MTINISFAFVACIVLPIAVLTSCVSYQQTCEDEVCTTVRDGKTTYSGDQAKIQAMQDKERAELKIISQLNAGPKRNGDEPIRVALIFGGASDNDLQALVDKYEVMIMQALTRFTDLQILPSEQVYSAINYYLNPNGYMQSKYTDGPQFKSDIKSLRGLWKNGLQYDVAVVWRLRSKEDYGFLGNSSGAAVAQVNLVEFDARFSSIFKSKALQEKAVGKSTNSLAAAGMDKTGKTGRFGLTGNRNPEYDRPAIFTWTSQIHTKILHDIKPSLPALAALNDIEKNRAPASVRPGGVDAKAAEKKIRDWFKK